MNQLEAFYEAELVAYLRDRGYIVRKPRVMNHGLRGTYAKGCRCELCRTAQSRYARRYYREGTYYAARTES